MTYDELCRLRRAYNSAEASYEAGTLSRAALNQAQARYTVAVAAYYR